MAQLEVGVRCCVLGDRDRDREKAVEVRRQCWSGIVVGVVDDSVCPKAKVVAVASQSRLKGALPQGGPAKTSANWFGKGCQLFGTKQPR